MTPEQAAERFTSDMLAQIRHEFFKGKTDREFFQERNMLLQAISHPSDWLKQRGIEKMSPARYREILQTVLTAIRRHAQQSKIKRFSAYFLLCVQRHMQHHGDEYYYAAKEVRGIGTMLPEALRGIQPGATQDTFIDVLATVHNTLRSRGGRKKRVPMQALALDLFDDGSARSQSASN